LRRDQASFPRIYYMPHRQVGAVERFAAHLDRARDLGFDSVLLTAPFRPGGGEHAGHVADHGALDPVLGTAWDTGRFLGWLAEECGSRGLALLLDLSIDRLAAEHPLAAGRPDCFRTRRLTSDAPIDPRRESVGSGLANARWGDPACADALAAWWEGTLSDLLRGGVAGFRCLEPGRAGPAVWRRLIETSRQVRADACFIASTYGMARRSVLALEGSGFDYVLSSLPWWDCRASWFVEEYEACRLMAPPIAAPEAPGGPRLAAGYHSAKLARAVAEGMLRLAVATGCGLLVPMGFEFGLHERFDPARATPEAFDHAMRHATLDLGPALRAANALIAKHPVLRSCGELRSLSGPGARATALLRVDSSDVRTARDAMLILINPDREHACSLQDWSIGPGMGADFEKFEPVGLDHDASPEDTALLQPGEIRLLQAPRAKPVLIRQGRRTARQAAKAPRLVIANVSPSGGGPAYAVKRIVGDAVAVEADVFSDGHDLLGVELQWRAVDDSHWVRARMTALGNDRWAATLPLQRLGRHEFAVEAWLDRYGSLAQDLAKKVEARVDMAQDVVEGRLMIEAARGRARGDLAGELEAILEEFEAVPQEERVALLLDPATRAAMAQADDRPFSLRSEVQRIDADRTAAGFASWYELFPRSQTDDPKRHGRFSDVIARLPAIRAMGFDVLYMTPIHPIGERNRKGRNNSLTARPGDPGSPYAIGGAAGGHDAIHPELGTVEDFRALVRAADRHGMEIALDFAIQCSPDHPWLEQHPGWFAWRPDGSLKYAENPPKKYEDIVNVDFYAKDAVPDLWIALRDVVRYWIGEGVRTFRVDNPHTKPLPFWEWLIADIRGARPDVIFLSEAFTRPKRMYRLAQIGFSQSYTYFTWRNTKRELTEYLTELTTTEVREYFRPHFFVNTPDINPIPLQTAGRSGFLCRAALAATLSGLWGMYSGFELLEAEPIPGREEYWNSEKYEIKPRDWSQPGSIIEDIARLNRIRKANPALHSHLGLAFYNAFNDQILYYGKSTPAREEIVLVAVNLDFHAVQECDFEIPLWEWGLPDHGSLDVEDLLADRRFVWTGKIQHLRLDPDEMPFAIWRVQPHRG